MDDGYFVVWTSIFFFSLNGASHTLYRKCMVYISFTMVLRCHYRSASDSCNNIHYTTARDEGKKNKIHTHTRTHIHIRQRAPRRSPFFFSLFWSISSLNVIWYDIIWKLAAKKTLWLDWDFNVNEMFCVIEQNFENWKNWKHFIHKFLKIQVFKTQNLVKKMMKTLNSMKKFINKLFGNVKIFNIFR